jgi:primosomal protein N' (replication factor Y)
MVTDSKEVSTTKTALRAATFSLRKLPAQEDAQKLSRAFIETADEIAKWYAASTSMVLYSLLPPDIRSGDIPLPHTHHAPHDDRSQPELLTATKHGRYLAYRSLVRETFAHSGSVLCVVPSSAEVDEMLLELTPGVEERVIEFSSMRTKKQLREAYARLEDFTRPKLIIATPSYAIIERHDITTVIVEHARSPHYKERARPYLDFRDVLRIHAKHMGRRIVFGDLLPRAEEEHQRRSEVYQTLGATPKRIDLPSKLEIVHFKDKPNGGTPFQLFSGKVLKAIEATKKAKGRTFLFAARRGLAPVVACIDCGYIFRSPQSGAPYSLVRTKKDGREERWFVCPTSGHRERAADTCSECGSWRLRERGIGIQYVHDELSKLLPETPVILFDHTSANTYKKARFLRDKFYETKGAIMIGTHMAIPYLTKPINTSVVVNMDALYATPTWRLQEENVALLLRLREMTSEAVYVQTRTENDELMRQVRQGAIERFYNEELELRKTFNYPPFTTFVHLTWQGTQEAMNSIESYVKQSLKRFDVSIYSAPPSPKGTQIRYGLIRLASTDWPNAELSNVLRSLPPSVRMVINPDRIV